jgi:hypothetical protein
MFALFLLSREASHSSTTLLASGVSVATHEASVATVYYSSSSEDTIVAATALTTAAAKAAGARPYDPTMTFIAAPGDGVVVPLVTYYSATLKDTLTTSSASGYAWAANASNGYVRQRVEGYCLAAAPPAPSPSSPFMLVQYVQMWSAERGDTFLVAKDSAHYDVATDAKYAEAFAECWVVVSTVPGSTGQWTTWPNDPQFMIPWPKSKDLLGWQYLSGANPGYGGGNHVAGSADTWYPSWAADNKLYTSWTDGSVHDDVTGRIVTSGSGGKPAAGYNSTTGQAVIVGDDPFRLNITEVATFNSSTYPYEGRYPCGQLAYKGVWYYGTYFLDNPNASVGGNYVGPSPGPNCGNWCVQGPVVDFRYSNDRGKTWVEPRLKAASASDNLFGETAAKNAKVKFGAPHWVDFGQELEHSPDGKAYIVGHGASKPTSIQAWMLGDEVYMARVVPNAASIGDVNEWEFYAGGHGADAKWVKGDVGAAAPLVAWDFHTGVVTMTYFAALKKYILTISTATYYPSMTKQFDTYFLESDAITGPWAYAHYASEFGPEAYFVHHPSKFLAKRANTKSKTYDCFLMYSANFAFHDGASPPNSGYHMNLQQARFPLSSAFAAKLAARYAEEDAAKMHSAK